MASLQVYRSRNQVYARIVESYRVPGCKNPKTRVLQNLGRVEELESKDPGILERLRKELKENRKLEDTLRTKAMERELEELLSGNPCNSSEGLTLQNIGYGVYKHLWDELKLDGFFDYRQKRDTSYHFALRDVVFLLLCSRLLHPSSKKQAVELQGNYFGLPEVSLDAAYESLGCLSSLQGELEVYLNKRLSEKRERSMAVAFYDVTTFYFESVRVDDLKRFGYSKDNKVNQVQVVMGLLIDEHGIPFGYELFPGNTNDFGTLIPVMKKIRETYGITKLILTADRGLNSGKNLLWLRENGFEYVLSFKIRSAKEEVKQKILQGEYATNDMGLRWRLDSLGQKVGRGKEAVFFEDQLVITWSPKRAAKDKADRQRLMEKARKLAENPSLLKSEMKKGGKKYVQLSFFEDTQIRFDTQKAELDEAFDGYYAIQSSDKSLRGLEMVEIYHHLWKIEESFRLMKTNLEARPIFVWTKESIEGHFVLCYLALFLQRWLEQELREKGVHLSTEKIQEALRSANISVAPGEDVTRIWMKNEPRPAYREILEALGLPEISAMGRVHQLKV